MKNDALQSLLLRYIRGKCTPEEVEFVDHWYLSQEQNPDDHRLHDDEAHAALESKIRGRINAQLEASTPSIVQYTPRVRANSFRYAYPLAAAVILLVLASATAMFYEVTKTEALVSRTVDEKHHIIQVTNTSFRPTKKALSDGSVITLQPKGVIEFPSSFTGNTREVKLTGEAFFEVAKDKNRPFIITTGEIAVKVLGTSFNIKAYSGAREISVAVRTGKVSVYTNHQPSKVNLKPREEIILTPNQEVVYNKVREDFSKKIVDEPQVIPNKKRVFQTQYDATPVNEIFEELEANYGIDIVFDQETLAGCQLTSSMDEEGLYERVIIICQAIGAKYEIKDGTIEITSNGCP